MTNKIEPLILTSNKKEINKMPHIQLFKNYTLEISGFRVYGGWDNIVFFDFDINLLRFVGDHMPQFTVKLIIFNLLILDFEIYNTHHFNECEKCKKVYINDDNSNICPACGNNDTINICPKCGREKTIDDLL